MAPSVINVKEYETLLVPSKSQKYIGKSNSFLFKKTAMERESLSQVCQLPEGGFCYFPWEVFWKLLVYESVPNFMTGRKVFRKTIFSFFTEKNQINIKT